MKHIYALNELLEQKHGDCSLTFLGRNDLLIKRALESMKIFPHRILMAGPGHCELWTMAGQEIIYGKDVKIVGVERDRNIVSYNQNVKEGGMINIAEICRMVSDPLMVTEEECLENITFARIFLDAARIKGIQQEGEFITVALQNREKVVVEPPEDIRTYVKKQKEESFDFIFAGHLESNLVYQEFYDYNEAISYHRNLSRILQRGGFYVFTAPEMLFHNTENKSCRNITEVLGNSGFEILYKGTRVAKLLEREEASVLLEDCGVICGKKSDYGFFPGAETIMKKADDMFRALPKDIAVKKSDGPYQKFLGSLRKGETNLVLVKSGEARYEWLNIIGNPKEVFIRLSAINTWAASPGFYTFFLN